MSAVSVIATVLNEAQDIDGLVTSLIQQTLQPAEVVVVDGGSTDGTWERLQASALAHANLKAIRDESCSLKGSPGPIARGRNVAITAASSEVIACADAGCVYRPDWLENLTEPILSGRAEYALGGSCLDAGGQTTWDIASAPFFGIKLDPNQETKSCTARSMAFRKKIWQKVGGFPEDRLIGEDSLFDLRVRQIVIPAFPERAKALYRPGLTLRTAIAQVARYAISDGASGIRRARLLRNLARCLAEVLTVAIVARTVVPLVCVLLLEIYFAFRLDWKSFPGKTSVRQLSARLFFSLIVPWLVTWNHIVGALSKTNQPNRQNVAG
jgi:glycosyltransferase involved in cell wall biosynthesis